MNEIRVLVALISLGVLTSCATPVGQFDESDMHWTKFETELNYQAVYRNVNEGFGKCGSHWLVEGKLYTDIEEGRMDIYVFNKYGSTNWVYGLVNVKSIDLNHSDVEIGVNKRYDNSVFSRNGVNRDMFSRWASGTYQRSDC